jgi:hypothetical protein
MPSFANLCLLPMFAKQTRENSVSAAFLTRIQAAHVPRQAPLPTACMPRRPRTQGDMPQQLRALAAEGCYGGHASLRPGGRLPCRPMSFDRGNLGFHPRWVTRR